MLEMALAAFLLRRTGVALNMSRSPSAFLRFILLGAMVPPLVSSTLGALIVQSIGYAGFGRVWLSWYEGAVLGTLSILPLTVQLQQHGLQSLRSPKRPNELFFYVPLVLLVTLVSLRLLPTPFVYLSLPLLLAAVRPAGTALLVTLTSFSGGLMVAMGVVAAAGDAPVAGRSPSTCRCCCRCCPAAAGRCRGAGRRRQRELAISEARFRDAMEHSAIGMALVGWMAACSGSTARCARCSATPAELVAMSFQDITQAEDLSDDLERCRRSLAVATAIGWRSATCAAMAPRSGRCWRCPWCAMPKGSRCTSSPRSRTSTGASVPRPSWPSSPSAIPGHRRQWRGRLGVGPGQRRHDLGRQPVPPLRHAPAGAAGELRGVRFVHPGDAEALHRELQRVREGLARLDVEFRISLPNGETRALRGHGSLALDAEGKPTRMIGTNWDVTQLRELTERLNDERERLQVTLNCIGDGVITTDLDGRVRFLNPVAERLSGWSTAAARNQEIERVLPLESEEGRPVPSPVRLCLERGTEESIPGLSLRHAAGGLIALRGQAAPVRSAEGELLGSVLVFTDVSEARAMQKHLRYAASHDALTGLLNRSAFEDALAESCREVTQNAGHSVLFFIDLDLFKQVNDSAGHAAGDELLRRISRLMQEQVRSGDLVARLGATSSP